MSFTSWQYGFFLPLVMALYWALPWRGRIGLLLVSSYIFYGVWDVRFLSLLLTSTAIDYFCGRAIAHQRVALKYVLLAASLPVAWLVGCKLWPGRGEAVTGWIVGAGAAFPILFVTLYAMLWRLPEGRQRHAFLILSIVNNLVVLGFFKYFSFFAASALAGLARLGWQPGWTLPHIILPVAISFYTFQSIAYAVDIYRGKVQPERDYVTFAAYLSFFPQLVAGPIERPAHLLPQFQKPAVWNVEHLHAGSRLILMGLFKKVFVADNCALLDNYAFDPKTVLNAPWAILGVVAFAVQIYGDFSGYTDIARGSARLLGIELMPNFRFPYLARGPSEFWQRWHITLSSWFRDYVYIPLGGNRGGLGATLRNLWITMLLAGLWHGANWTFVLWGAYHAALLAMYRVVPGLRRLEEGQAGFNPRTLFAIALMSAFTLGGWAIFRCASLSHLGAWLTALTRWNAADGLDWTRPGLWLLLHGGILFLLQWVARKSLDEAEVAHVPWVARGIIYTLLLLGIASSVTMDQEFIYFQF
ncbi:MAG TPA: MBOAT family O-acyltransferase [Verrucomicrobiae bacterium]|nr:MBOAT family O-acyltransferase [Verrucomicrobiae bacterium]